MPLPLALVVVSISALLHWRLFYPRFISTNPMEHAWQVIGWFVTILLNFAVAMVVFVASMFF